MGSGNERADRASRSSGRLLDLLLTRPSEPAVDEPLTIVATNDAFAALGGTDRVFVGEPFTAVAPNLTEDDIESSLAARR